MIKVRKKKKLIATHNDLRCALFSDLPIMPTLRVCGDNVSRYQRLHKDTHGDDVLLLLLLLAVMLL